MRTRIPSCIERLKALGISEDDALALRRISMTLRRWHELECGDSNDHASWSIVRGHKPPRQFYRDPETQAPMWRDGGAQSSDAWHLHIQQRRIERTACTLSGAYGSRNAGRALTPAFLREIGEALYGPQWRQALARSLGRSQRTVRRWADGAYPIPIDTAPALRAVIEARQGKMSELLGRL